MKICVFEDNANSLMGLSALENDGYDCWITSDFRDLTEWIVLNPPDFFTALIMDLQVPSHSLYFIPECKDYNINIDHSPTLFYIERFLLKKYPEIQEKIILCSAYFDKFSTNNISLKQVSKSEENPITQLINALQLLSFES